MVPRVLMDIYKIILDRCDKPKDIAVFPGNTDTEGFVLSCQNFVETKPFSIMDPRYIGLQEWIDGQRYTS